MAGELRIAPDLQEVIDRINQVYFSAEIRRAKDDRAKEQEHRPGFHIPRITRVSPVHLQRLPAAVGLCPNWHTLSVKPKQLRCIG